MARTPKSTLHGTKASGVWLDEFDFSSGDTVLEVFVGDMLVWKGEESVATNAIKGRRVCVTGTLSTMTRAQAHAAIIKLGGIVMPNVTRSTGLLITGAKPGSKMDLASKYGIETWNEVDFQRAITNSGDPASPFVSIDGRTRKPTPPPVPAHYGEF